MKKINYWAFPMFKEMVPESQRPYDSIIKVLDFNGITMQEIVKRSRKREYVDTRRLCIAILRYDYNWTLVKIGKLFDQDHSSVIHSLQKIKELIQVDERVRNQVERFCPQLLTKEILYK
jgi:chromosomal replication initiator protein